MRSEKKSNALKEIGAGDNKNSRLANQKMLLALYQVRDHVVDGDDSHGMLVFVDHR